MPDPVQPGWQPDPQQPGMLRWWNGLGWSDARKSADGGRAAAVRPAAEGDLRRGLGVLADARADASQEVARLAAEARGAAGAAGAGGAARQVGTAVRAGAAANSLAASALVIGIIGFVVGAYGVLPLIGLLVSLAALSRSRRLARDGVRRTGFGPSVAGLLLSVLGLIRWVPAFVALLQTFDIS